MAEIPSGEYFVSLPKMASADQSLWQLAVVTKAQYLSIPERQRNPASAFRGTPLYFCPELGVVYPLPSEDYDFFVGPRRKVAEET